MGTWMGVLSVVAALVVLPVRVEAQSGTDERLRTLEQQLRRAEAKIEELQRGARQRGSGAQRAPHSRRAHARTEHPPDAVEALTSRAQSDDPVVLLLEALHKRGTIADSDYEELKRAILAKKEHEEQALTVQEGRSEGTVPQLQAKEADDATGRDRHKKRLPVTASYAIGKGLTLRTDNRTFDLTIRNLLQTGYTFTQQDDPSVDDTSSFRVRRMQMRMRGHFLSPTLLYQVKVELAGRPHLNQAFLRWKPSPYFGVQAGQYQVPFSRQRLTFAGAQQFVDRASPDTFFAFGNDQGVKLLGRAFGPKNDRLVWNAGIFNGNGSNQPINENTGHLAAGRLLYMPLGGFNYYSESDVENSPTPRFGIGAAYAFNSQADSGAKKKASILRDTGFGRFFGTDFVDKFDISEATADSQFKYRGFSLLGDYYWARAAPNSAPAKTARGYNIQAGYFIIPKRLEAAMRYAFIDRDVDAPRSGLREIGGALGYFFLAHNLKLQMDIRDILDEAPRGKTRDTMEYRTQLQAIF